MLVVGSIVTHRRRRRTANKRPTANTRNMPVDKLMMVSGMGAVRLRVRARDRDECAIERIMRD